MNIRRLAYLIFLGGILGTWNGVISSEIGFPKPTSSSESFESLVKSKHYVDKSKLIKVLLSDEFHNAVVVITAPKQFGKSSNMQMMKTFCEIQDPYTRFPHAQNIGVIADTPNYRLFTDKHFFGTFKVTKDLEFMRKHFGKYPVIQLDFAETMKQIKSFQDYLDVMRETIAKVFLEHVYLYQSPALFDFDKTLLSQWNDPHKRLQMKDEAAITCGVADLASLLNKHFNRKVIILIDEYDMIIRSVLLSESLTDVEVKNIIESFTLFVSKSTKDRSYFKLTLLTGVSYIASVRFSEYVPRLYPFLFGRNMKFYRYYGFTETEMDYLFSIEPSVVNQSMKEEARRFYDGYLANDEAIFTPESVINFLETGEIKSYWSNTAVSSKYWQALRLSEIRERVLKLLERKSIVFELEDLRQLTLINALAFRECVCAKSNKMGNSIEVAAFLNFILDAGCLKITSRDHTHLHVEVPNSDVRDDVTALLVNYYNSSFRNDSTQNYLEDNFVNGLRSIDAANFKANIATVADNLNELTNRRIKTLGNNKETGLNQLIRTILFINHIKYHTEAPVYKASESIGQEKTISKFIDILIAELPHVYAAIECKYGEGKPQKLAEQALYQIYNEYTQVVAAPEYSSSQKPWLLLGIIMLKDTSIAIAANFVHLNKRIDKTLVIPATAKRSNDIEPDGNKKLKPVKPMPRKH